MKNLARLSFTSLMFIGWVNAQEAPAPSMPSVFSQPKAEMVKKTEDTDKFKADFDVIRANSYGTAVQGNAAAAFTVSDYLLIPHLLTGKKLVYIEPTNASGVAAFDMSGNTLFVGLENAEAGSTGVTTFGMATATWGAYLRLGLNQVSTKDTPVGGAATTTDNANSGQQLGLGFSAPVGGNAFYLDADYVKTGDEVDVDSPANTIKDSQYLLSLIAHYANFPSAQGLFWDLRAGFYRNEVSSEVTAGGVTTTTVSPVTHTGIVLGANAGEAFASNDYSRAFIGVNSELDYLMYDDIDGTSKAHSNILFSIAPNISAEYAVTKDLFFTGGVSHSIGLGYGSEEFYTGVTKVSDETTTAYLTQITQAATAVRYQYKTLSLEAGLTANVYNDGTAVLFNGSGVMANLGAMITF